MTVVLAGFWAVVVSIWLGPRLRLVARAPHRSPDVAERPPLRFRLPPAASGVTSAFARVLRRPRSRNALDPLAVSAVIDMLAVATTAGLRIDAAIDALAKRVDPPFDESVSDAIATLRAGGDRATAVGVALTPAGHLGSRVASAIADADRDGASLTATLTRASIDLEQLGRREAEARARRLPVKLLFPLVTCVLPAFALLTVMPLLAGSLGSLPY